MIAPALAYPNFWRVLLHRAAERRRMAFASVQSPLAARRQAGEPLAVGVSGLSIKVNCTMTAVDGTLLVNYPWTAPLDVRPGINQFQYLFGNVQPTIYNNTLYYIPGTGGQNISLNCGVSDCTITATYFSGQTSGTSVQNMHFRLFNSVNYWIAYRYSDGNVRIYRAFALVSTIPYAWINNQYYTMTAVLNGPSIKFYINTDLLLDISDSTNINMTTHGVGQMMQATIVNRSTVDNFKVMVP